MKNLTLLLTLLFTTSLFSQSFDYKRYNSFLQKHVSFSGQVNYDAIDKVSNKVKFFML